MTCGTYRQLQYSVRAAMKCRAHTEVDVTGKVTGAIAVAACLAAATVPALSGEGIVSISSLGLPLALSAATAARDACVKLGFRVSVSIVDASGNIVVTLRDELAAPHTMLTSQRKAYTSLTMRMPTNELARMIAARPDAAGLQHIDGLLALGGGLPLRVNNEVVGGIGVSGVTNDYGDELCAEAGNAIVQLQAARPAAVASPGTAPLPR